MDPIKAIGVILIASFLIDRVVNAAFFLLSFSAAWRHWLPDPASVTDPLAVPALVRKRTLVYSITAGILATVVLAWYLDIRILALTGLDPLDPKTKLHGHPYLDALLTGLIVAAGAERIADALKMLGAPLPDSAGAKPLAITGKLVIEDGAAKITATGQRV
jgi:hypothetical protein